MWCCGIRVNRWDVQQQCSVTDWRNFATRQMTLTPDFVMRKIQNTSFCFLEKDRRCIRSESFTEETDHKYLVLDRLWHLVSPRNQMQDIYCSVGWQSTGLSADCDNWPQWATSKQHLFPRITPRKRFRSVKPEGETLVGGVSGEQTRFRTEKTASRTKEKLSTKRRRGFSDDDCFLQHVVLCTRLWECCTSQNKSNSSCVDMFLCPNIRSSLYGFHVMNGVSLLNYKCLANKLTIAFMAPTWCLWSEWVEGPPRFDLKSSNKWNLGDAQFRLKMCGLNRKTVCNLLNGDNRSTQEKLHRKQERKRSEIAKAIQSEAE